ncbi:cation/calcium exchanger 1-like [Iris pallida]|uniref:Cation/calcium exchanger 1-like n=1 Tax=Iris pallida TaxID=29817 RepID=A0AAX6E8K3_IRIPA|nr:cation/calcium exchanger 1-like [Iris pallida]KAJ6800344.1 cation/calcium exchanger 1-like [Iris pallida]
MASSSFLLLVLYSTLLYSSSARSLPRSDGVDGGCDGLRRRASSEAKCAYLVFQTHECSPEGYINYLRLFYCVFGGYPALGYLSLFLWLVLLFYLLGNTAADYFCSNLAGLSRLLNLHPTVAGVTLLSLGNGAPDVFSSVVSFAGTSSSASLVGLNSVLGGAFFVSTVVVGVVSICVAPRKVSVDRSCFMRDVLFLLFVLLVLLAILSFRTINVWSAVAFAGLYLAYVFLVSMTHVYGRHKDHVNVSSLLPLKASAELAAPLLAGTENSGGGEGKQSTCGCIASRTLRLLELPLYLPRRLTIPVVTEERWSKPFAVASVTLAPTLLVALWDSKEAAKLGSKERTLVYLFGASTGTLLGISTALGTDRESPPTRLLLPWLAGGFLMSVSWTYITAQELVSLLVSAGFILDMSPSVLGLTVLAWGNSLGDLVANVAVAVGGGAGGAQVAVSGCYGGPIFNTLVGLGASLALASWARYPTSVDIPRDPTLFVTVGFLVAGLLWALVVLPRRGMKPDRVLGVGLIAIYLCFLCVRLGQSLGLVEL